MLRELAGAEFRRATVVFDGTAYQGHDRLLIQATPSLSALAATPFPVGFVCQRMGDNSHLAVVARSRGIFCAVADGGTMGEHALDLGGVTLREGARVELTDGGLVSDDGVIPVLRMTRRHLGVQDCAPYGLDLY